MDQGESDDEIAVRLGIPRTGVGWHVERTLEKLGAASRDEAVARYRRVTA